MLRRSSQNAFLKLAQNDEQYKFSWGMKSCIYSRPKLLRPLWGEGDGKSSVVTMSEAETKMAYRVLFKEEWIERVKELTINGISQQCCSSESLLQGFNESFISFLETIDWKNEEEMKRFEVPLLMLKKLLKRYTWKQEEIAQKILGTLEAEQMIAVHSGNLCNVMSENWNKLKMEAVKHKVKFVKDQLKEFRERKKSSKSKTHVITENGMQTIEDKGAALALEFLNKQCKAGWSDVQSSWEFVVMNEVGCSLRALTFERLENLLQESLDIFDKNEIRYADDDCYTARESMRRFLFFSQFIEQEAQLYAGLFNHVCVITCRDLDLLHVFEDEEHRIKLLDRIAKNGVHISLSRNEFQKEFDAIMLGNEGTVTDWKYHAELLHEVLQDPRETVELDETLTELGNLCKQMKLHEHKQMNGGSRNAILEYVEECGVSKLGGAFGTFMLSQFRVHEIIDFSLMKMWGGSEELDPDKDDTYSKVSDSDISKDIVYYALLRANMILKNCQYPKRLLSVFLGRHEVRLSPKTMLHIIKEPQNDMANRVRNLRVECSGGPKRLLKKLIPLQKIVREFHEGKFKTRILNEVEGVYLNDEEVDELYEEIAAGSSLVMEKVSKLGLEQEVKELSKAAEIEKRKWNNLVSLTLALWIFDLAAAMASHCLERDPGLNANEKRLTGRGLIAMFQRVYVTK